MDFSFYTVILAAMLLRVGLFFREDFVLCAHACVCVYMSMSVPWTMCGGERTPCGIWFFSFYHGVGSTDGALVIRLGSMHVKPHCPSLLPVLTWENLKVFSDSQRYLI